MLVNKSSLRKIMSFQIHFYRPIESKIGVNVRENHICVLSDINPVPISTKRYVKYIYGLYDNHILI